MATRTHAKSVVAVERFSASDPGAWSNSYLISDGEDALLFDVFQLRSDAEKLADSVEASGKKLREVWISHAHPDHWAGLDVLSREFADAPISALPTRAMPKNRATAAQAVGAK